MSRRTYGLREFTVELDMEPDRENTSFAMRCSVCSAFGPVIESVKEESGETQLKADEEARRIAAGWLSAHRRERHEHLSYRLIQTIPYRIVPGDWT